MLHALRLLLDAFRKHLDAEQRVLVLISGDQSTGDPLPIAHKLQQAKATLAVVNLTSSRAVTRRCLYGRTAKEWNMSQHTLLIGLLR